MVTAQSTPMVHSAVEFRSYVSPCTFKLCLAYNLPGDEDSRKRHEMEAKGSKSRIT